MYSVLKMDKSIIYTCYQNFKLQNFVWVYVFFQTGSHYLAVAGLDLPCVDRPC